MLGIPGAGKGFPWPRGQATRGNVPIIILNFQYFRIPGPYVVISGPNPAGFADLTSTWWVVGTSVTAGHEGMGVGHTGVEAGVDVRDLVAALHRELRRAARGAGHDLRVDGGGARQPPTARCRRWTPLPLSTHSGFWGWRPGLRRCRRPPGCTGGRRARRTGPRAPPATRHGVTSGQKLCWSFFRENQSATHGVWYTADVNQRYQRRT